MTENESKEKLRLVIKLVDELISYDKELGKCPYSLNYILTKIYNYIMNDEYIDLDYANNYELSEYTLEVGDDDLPF